MLTGELVALNTETIIVHVNTQTKHKAFLLETFSILQEHKAGKGVLVSSTTMHLHNLRQLQDNRFYIDYNQLSEFRHVDKQK